MIPRRRYLILSLSAAIVAVVCVFMWRNWTEPRYQGKKLSLWLEDMPFAPDFLQSVTSERIDREYPLDSRSREAIAAIRGIGEAAVPYLIADAQRAKRTGLNRLVSWLHLSRLGIPPPGMDLDTHFKAVTALCVLGEKAANAQPQLRRWATGELGSQACVVLEHIGPASDGTLREILCDSKLPVMLDSLSFVVLSPSIILNQGVSTAMP